MRVHVYVLGAIPLVYLDHDRHEAPPEAIPCGSLDLSRAELHRVVKFLEERTIDMLRRGHDVGWIVD